MTKKEARDWTPRVEDESHDCEQEHAMTEQQEADLEREVVKALLELPERTRTVFCLDRYEGWSFDEIAEGLDIPVRMVEIFSRRANMHMLMRSRSWR